MTAVLHPLPVLPPAADTHGEPTPLWSSPPIPSTPIGLTPKGLRPLPDIPFAGYATPSQSQTQTHPQAAWPPPLGLLPATGAYADPPATDFSAVRPAPIAHDEITPLLELLGARVEPLARETPEPTAAQLPPEPPAADFTDEDLREAFAPIVEMAVRNAVYARENGIDTYLEPMLRSTIRRALAEYSPTQRPFQTPGLIDWAKWKLQALFTSRSYEDIIFEKTHRFQVEEVFLLDVASLALISFASNDPARHASAKRVEGTVQRLALQLRDAEGRIRSGFDLPEHRRAVSWSGRFTVLVAVVRGRSNELVTADLEFALKRIEDRFRDRIGPGGPPLMQDLQPYLEDCLLIQAPANAA